MTKREYSDKQINFIYSKEYVTKDEIKDMIEGYTDPEVLLDPDDYDEFLKIGG